ncbi:hypothetical protein [Streptomyces sp. NPDC058872]|uniref:hypothetical protein n=1 Tax=Streptomyces sp. NPDC058872 TaxID=3346661 RepID=UPI0036BD2E9B
MRYRDVPGLSGRANAAVRELEGKRLSPGVVAAALSVWSVRVHGTKRDWRPWEAEFTCRCCGEEWARDTLQSALWMLPPRAAGELRRHVDRLDAVLLDRTHHEPAAEAELPWWHRRC